MCVCVCLRDGREKVSFPKFECFFDLIGDNFGSTRPPTGSATQLLLLLLLVLLLLLLLPLLLLLSCNKILRTTRLLGRKLEAQRLHSKFLMSIFLNSESKNDAR